MKIHKKLKKFSNKYIKCFTESEQKFPTEKSFEISNFYGLPKIRKSKVRESDSFSKHRGGFLDTLVRSYLNHIKSYI